MHINFDNLEIVKSLKHQSLLTPRRDVKEEAWRKPTKSVPPVSAKEGIIAAVSHFFQVNWSLLEENCLVWRFGLNFPSALSNATLKSYNCCSFVATSKQIHFTTSLSAWRKSWRKLELMKTTMNLFKDFPMNSPIPRASGVLQNAESSADSAEPRIETDNLVPFSQYISKSLE